MLQHGLFPLHEVGAFENAADNHPVLQKVMKDDEAARLGFCQVFARLLAAEGIEGADDGEGHAGQPS